MRIPAGLPTGICSGETKRAARAALQTVNQALVSNRRQGLCYATDSDKKDGVNRSFAHAMTKADHGLRVLRNHFPQPQ